MPWTVEFIEEFEPEFDLRDEAVQDELLAGAKLLEQFGPSLGRPWVDTLKGARHANLKELRLDAGDGVWQVAFAFDRGAAESCSRQVTSPAAASGGSTARSSSGPTSGSMCSSHA